MYEQQKSYNQALELHFNAKENYPASSRTDA